MLVSVLSFFAVVLTVLRSWPQFVRILVRKERSGVSLSTWLMAVANHTGWFMYGILSAIPLFTVVNVLAGAGCVATAWTLSSWRPIAVVVIMSTLLSLSTFAIADAVLLTTITALSFGMFLPQLGKVIRTSAEGVSIATWSVAALASATWIAYACAIHRPTIAVAHFFMLPASLIIIVRTSAVRSVEGQRTSVEIAD